MILVDRAVIALIGNIGDRGKTAEFGVWSTVNKRTFFLVPFAKNLCEFCVKKIFNTKGTKSDSKNTR